MKHVLYVGQDPATVDFSDPSLPDDADAAKIQAGIEQAMHALSARGWNAVRCMIPPDAAGIDTLTRTLQAERFDCVVVGGGLRIPSTLRLFEQVINAIHAAAPQARIAFNTTPDDTAAAAARWI